MKPLLTIAALLALAAPLAGAGGGDHRGLNSGALTGFCGAVPFGPFFATTSRYVGATLFLSLD